MLLNEEGCTPYLGCPQSQCEWKKIITDTAGIQIPDIQIAEPFEYQTIQCPLFRCPITLWYSNVIWIADKMVCYSDGDLNSELIVRYLDGDLNTRPFDDRTGFNHSNTELFQNSNPHCIRFLKTGWGTFSLLEKGTQNSFQRYWYFERLCTWRLFITFHRTPS